MLKGIEVNAGDNDVSITFISDIEKLVINIPKELAYKFADGLYKELYDEPSYKELEDRVYSLENVIEELEDRLEYVYANDYDIY